MQIFALRMMTLGSMLVLYKVSPVLGIAVLSTGLGFVIGQRVCRQRSAL